MPRLQVDLIDYSKLPRSLMGGAFSLSHGEADRSKAYYKFHDQLWMADTRHLLGWSREALHSLDRSGQYEPDWLFGHSFKRSENGYKLSGANDQFSVAQMINLASDLANHLDGADVSIDQWAHTSHEAWHANLLEQGMLSQQHPLYRLVIERNLLTPIELWNLLKNHSDFTHHPAYPDGYQGPSVIQTPRSEAEHEELRRRLRALRMMASGIGQSHANTIITSDFQNSAMTGAATTYLAVFTAAPSDTGVGTEVSTTNTAYARIAITMNSTNLTPVSAGTVLLAIVETYAVCGSANYGTVTDVATMAASTGGSQPFYWGDLNASVIINTGNQLSFPPNSITFAYV